jgi:hypothetical protein
MFLVARELKSSSGKRATSMTEKHRNIMKDIDAKREALAKEIAKTEILEVNDGDD